METEKLKKNKIEDRISDLPDAIIQHILSFLPSTEEVIQTSVLSKRWRNQWTRVPVLIFDSLGMSYEKFLKFIDNTLLLHDCSKIHKFNLRYRYSKDKDPQFADRIFFATKKHVEKLILSSRTEEFLPEFLFNYASLVKLRTYQFNFMHNVKLINWGCLSSLKIAYCVLPYQAMEHILFGIPSLKSLKLISCAPQKIVIASKSLKKLFIHSSKGDVSVLEISCPNLEKLSLKRMLTDDTQMISQAIDNVLSSCLLLESFELSNCDMLDRKLVIASKSLKKFVLCDSYEKFDIEISCPLLEELKLLGYLNVKTAKLLNLPSSLSATIDFDRYGEQKTCESLVIEILQQLQHIKDLKIGSCFLQILSKVGARFSPVFNIKCLTVSDPHLIEHHSGIAHLLRNSPVLEKLVISVLCCKGNHIRKNYWYSNADVFNCLISHLKTIKIMGFPERIGRREHMLNFIKFLLENARVLDKMVVLLGDHIEISPSDLSQELLSLPRCSRKTIIEVIRSNSNKEKVKFL